jgi:DNA-binding CsgD family transcriptional regulator
MPATGAPFTSTRPAVDGAPVPAREPRAWGRIVWPLVGYGVVGGLLMAVLRWVEYRYLVVEHSFEIYGGLVAILFAGVGIWLGTRLTRRPAASADGASPDPAEPLSSDTGAGAAELPSDTARIDSERQRELGITARELEVLGLIAAGLSTREIAGRLFVSENTVKTHASRLFDKLGARRRTQAVQRGRELGLIAGRALSADPPKE